MYRFFAVDILKCINLYYSILDATTPLNIWLVSLNHNYCKSKKERKKEMFYLTTHSTHFIYGYMSSDIWLRTILIVRKETHCRHIGYSYRLTARVLLYAPSHRQDTTYHGLCYTSRGALAYCKSKHISDIQCLNRILLFFLE